MFRCLRTFCRDERGTFPATEWVFIATILILGACSYLATRPHVERTTAQRLLD